MVSLKKKKQQQQIGTQNTFNPKEHRHLRKNMIDGRKGSVEENEYIFF